MRKKSILVCDDNQQIARRWSSQIQEVCPPDFASESLPQAELVEVIASLEERRKNARSSGGHDGGRSKNRFDEADILVIDYDLLNLKSQSFITGENLSYLARCYSRCGLIVGLNQFGTNDFDLSLKGHPESCADLNVGGNQVSNPGLWKGEWTGFRPWHWPILPLALQAYERRIRELKTNLDEPIVPFLGLDNDETLSLPASTTEFLGRREDVTKITFRAFVSSSGNGLRPKDKAYDEETVARIAAARLWKWLERVVLAGQDILVDAPHLVSRFPSLLNVSRGKLESWNKSASLDRDDKVGLDTRKISKCRFRKSSWLSRPAWSWKCVRSINSILEVASPWDKEGSGFVFCEDISRFLPKASARRFVADLASPYVQRFVSDASSRECKRFAAALRSVNYRPQVRFSL